jgi:membrane-anchored protein YejM (alkaline phosphatase superfamily)
MYDHTVTDETSVKGKQSHVRDVHNTEETVDNQPRVILNKLNRTDMDDTVINITGQQNTEFDAWFASFKDASLDNLQPDSNM